MRRKLTTPKLESVFPFFVPYRAACFTPHAPMAASAAQIRTLKFASDKPRMRICTSSQRTTLIVYTGLSRAPAFTGPASTGPVQAVGPCQNFHSTPEW
jgi:hypothetical protein